jgi:hypothetical protein
MKNNLDDSWWPPVLLWLSGDCYLTDLQPLLAMYDLKSHENALDACEYLFDNYLNTLSEGTKKEDLIHFVDFLKNNFIPKLIDWFGSINSLAVSYSLQTF